MWIGYSLAFALAPVTLSLNTFRDFNCMPSQVELLGGSRSAMREMCS